MPIGCFYAPPDAEGHVLGSLIDADIVSSERPELASVSVPARTEVAGNHQDHQGGCVIAASVDRRITCQAHASAQQRILVESDDGARFSLDIDEPGFALPHEDERGTSKAIVRGMAAELIERGVRVSGCSLSFSSDIPIGMGLSSSAAFELCTGAALLAISGESFGAAVASPLDMAQIAMHVEQDYFGKPCGLMDQAACALGGMVYMDFALPEKPAIAELGLPEQWGSYDYLLVDTGVGHEESTSDYASVAVDMQAAASLLGIEHLRSMGYRDYLCKLPYLRRELGDAVALRALGFYIELDLVERRLCALREGDMQEFIRLTKSSSICSAEYLQNVALPGRSEPAMIACALCRSVLDEAQQVCGGIVGSARIHGGGFGGTIQVIVPNHQSGYFESRIEELLGSGCCMHVRLGASGIEGVPYAGHVRRRDHHECGGA